MRNNLQTKGALPYQAPEVNVWSIAAEQGFATSDFSELTENGGWGYNDK